MKNSEWATKYSEVSRVVRISNKEWCEYQIWGGAVIKTLEEIIARK
jgi:hypothetical protein